MSFVDNYFVIYCFIFVIFIGRFVNFVDYFLFYEGFLIIWIIIFFNDNFLRFDNIWVIVFNK